MRLTYARGALAASILLALTSCKAPPSLVGREEEGPAKPAGDERLEDQVLVLVESDPTGAVVKINNLRRETTPTQVLIDTNSDGSVISGLTIGADFSTNPRAAPGFGSATASYNAGDMLPSRIRFTTVTGANGAQTIEITQSGRAITRR